MIVRLVTMTFKEESTEAFLALFNVYKNQIRSSQGCTGLELIRNSKIRNQICTLSHWGNENFLNQYRDSELFGVVWPETKKLFLDKATAVSYEVLI